jgi:hypothetical protein
MGSYKNVSAWLAQSVLGSARPESHVAHFLKSVTVEDGRIVLIRPSDSADVGAVDKDD